MKRQWVKFPWDRLLGKQNIQAKGQNIRKVMGEWGGAGGRSTKKNIRAREN